MNNHQDHQRMSTGLKITLVVLFLLVFISLGLNMYLIQQLAQARNTAVQTLRRLAPAVEQTLADVDSELEAFQQSTLTFQIEVDQQIPLQTEIPFNESIEIPVQVTIPVQQEIKTTVMMDPFQAGLEIPVDITVPIDMEFPIDQVVPVAINRAIPISTTVPLSLTVPINIPVSNTDLAPYIDKLRQGLNQLQESAGSTLSEMGP